jgi:hypothetical protein
LMPTLVIAIRFVPLSELLNRGQYKEGKHLVGKKGVNIV